MGKYSKKILYSPSLAEAVNKTVLLLSYKLSDAFQNKPAAQAAGQTLPDAKINE